MMTLGKLLLENKEAIVRRWFDDVLATYAEVSAAAFRREKDPFANPVGHSLRVGTRGIFEALLDGQDAQTIHPYLQDIIKIRAIQELSASRAVDFIFRLKTAVRAQLGDAVAQPQLLSELAELERQIDQVALAAFDIFVACREQVSELRINEVKRGVAWVVSKLNDRGFTLEPAPIRPSGAAPGGRNGQRGGRP